VKSSRLFLPFIALIASSAFAAELPAGNIIQHYEWAQKGSTTEQRLQRFELFWAEHKPAGRVYDDDAHHIYTRKAAYALTRLYAKTGNAEKCEKIIDWLESDDRIR
jgi:hypothetical protein